MLHQVIDVISSVVPRWSGGSGGEAGSLLRPHLYPASLISAVVPLWSEPVLDIHYEPRNHDSYTNSSMLRLPSEVLAQILQHLPPNDLSMVCRVSREVLDEAERLLYVRVELSNVSHIKTWCDTVSQRPHLSPRTQSLKIIMPRQTNAFESMDLWQLNRACKSCTHLKELFILVDEDETLLDWDQYVDPLWFIEDCPFRLTKFVCNYLPPKLLGIFFISQPDIRILSVRGDWGVKASSGILPTLTAIDVDSFPAVRISKPQAIRTLQIHLSMFGPKLSAITRALTRHYTKLTSLSLVCNSTPWSMTEILQSIGGVLPSLKSFCYFDERTAHGHTNRASGSLWAALQKFDQLELLVLQPTIWVDADSFQLTVYDAFDDEDLSQSFAKATAACPTLLRAIFIVDSQRHCFTRTEDGHVQFELLEEMDDWDCLYQNFRG